MSKLVSVGIMKFGASKRPIAITILVTAMMGTSALLIGDRLLNFYIYPIYFYIFPLYHSNYNNQIYLLILIHFLFIKDSIR